MKLTLEFNPGIATLVITESNGERMEVRGNPGVGSTYDGDTLDRLIGSLNRMVNVSALFAGETVHLRGDWANEVRVFLTEENRLRELIFSCHFRSRYHAV